jgi:hypothetical protein
MPGNLQDIYSKLNTKPPETHPLNDVYEYLHNNLLPKDTREYPDNITDLIKELKGGREIDWILGEIDSPGISKILKSNLPLTKKAYAIAETKPSMQFLKDKQQTAKTLTEKLVKQEKFDEAMLAASDHQMWREAMEKMEGQIQHK